MWKKRWVVLYPEVGLIASYDSKKKAAAEDSSDSLVPWSAKGVIPIESVQVKGATTARDSG